MEALILESAAASPAVISNIVEKFLEAKGRTEKVREWTATWRALITEEEEWQRKIDMYNIGLLFAMKRGDLKKCFINEATGAVNEIKSCLDDGDISKVIELHVEGETSIVFLRYSGQSEDLKRVFDRLNMTKANFDFASFVRVNFAIPAQLSRMDTVISSNFELVFSMLQEEKEEMSKIESMIDHFDGTLREHHLAEREERLSIQNRLSSLERRVAKVTKEIEDSNSKHLRAVEATTCELAGEVQRVLGVANQFESNLKLMERNLNVMGKRLERMIEDVERRERIVLMEVDHLADGEVSDHRFMYEHHGAHRNRPRSSRIKEREEAVEPEVEPEQSNAPEAGWWPSVARWFA